MADKAISELDAASRLYTADLIPIEQGGVAKSINGEILANFAKEKADLSAARAQSYANDAEASAELAASWSAHPPRIGDNGNWWVYNVLTEQFEDSGVDASITVAIADITMLPEGDSPSVTNTGTATDPVFHLFIPRGATGATGNGIASIQLNSDYTLTITYTNGQVYTSGSIRGATGNGILNVVVNPDYTLTVTYTDGQTYTSGSIRGEKGEQGIQGEPGVSPVVTITSITGGHRVTITDATHPAGQSFDVMDGIGDMVAATYDPSGTVSAAGGIPNYVSGQIPHSVYHAVTLLVANWSDNTQTVTVTGVSATETDQLIQPVPASASRSEYQSCGVQATAQATNSLTFSCAETPANNLTVFVCLTELEAAT